ncbi:hypothetical protein BCR35DRAFT_62406 [Leucosporidium creatinivorum]|uniref:F-box domain-containing protein n=1 Tax=Leucosporidium creatinivorum TaxID=106004 RepID=A0A1Y2FJL5_9BASI|nr:hypothetical protein BCR35DRAFT_62406 [Leucosporidium creatinivorum]
MLPPPPAYSASRPTPSSPSLPGLLSLPQHLLLSILSHLPLASLCFSLRLTCRPLHLIATSLLRQQLLPSWHTRVKQRGNTTAAGGLWEYQDTSEAAPNVLGGRSRETIVLDHFIASIAMEALRSSESTLLQLADSSANQDLFEFMQPKARVEDLVVQWGREDGVVFLAGDSGRGNAKAGAGAGGGGTILGSDITVQLGPKQAKLFLPFKSSVGGGGSGSGVRTVEKCVVEVQRNEGETLEVVADQLVRGLKEVRVWREEKEGKGWYERG